MLVWDEVSGKIFFHLAKHLPEFAFSLLSVHQLRGAVIIVFSSAISSIALGTLLHWGWG